MIIDSRGVYLISNEDDFALLMAKLTAALATEQIRFLQYRRKTIPHALRYAEAVAVKALCDRYRVPLIINDDVELAARLGCGVHLGQGDGAVTAARAQLGVAAIIGRTCHDSLPLAQQAVADGADYLAFGAAYPSVSKPEAQPLQLDTLRQARRQFAQPICVIGGLTVENAAPLIAAGADYCAVIGDILNRPLADIAARVHQWAQLFSIHRT